MNTYIGERYSPVMGGEWEATTTYSRLTLVHYNDKGYISKLDVPTGTLPTDTNYWMLLYNNTTGTMATSWNDITDKPTSFPPSLHTQSWSTILGTPTEWPPSAHTHPISQVNGLDVTIDDIQQDIRDLQAGGGGIHIVDMYADSFTSSGIPTNNYIFKKYSNNYMEYDCYFIINNVALNGSVSQGWSSSLSLWNPINLPTAFNGNPVIQFSWEKNRTLGNENVVPFIFESTNPSSIIPSVYLRVLKDYAALEATGKLYISLKGF